MNLVFEGKSKQVYEVEKKDEVAIFFKDTVAFDAFPLDNNLFEGKAVLTAKINNYMFKKLGTSLPHHYLGAKGDNAFLAKRLKISPIRIVIRNFAAGSICERKGYKKGEWFVFPMLEYYLRENERDIVTDEATIVESGLLNFDQIDVMIDISRRANQILWTDFREKGIYLADIKFELGWDSEGNITLADELSPDSARIWGTDKSIILDKDAFIDNKSDLVQIYSKLVEILGA